MLITWFYSSSTLDRKGDCLNKNRGNTAMKHAEFINVWYDYARYVYGPKEHIYIIDNGSPIKFQDVFDVKEEVDYLDENQPYYNPFVFLHVKRFNEKLNHGGGVVRATLEGWKMSTGHNFDYIFSEADSLCMVNLLDELSGQDIITSNIEHGSSGCLDCSNWAVRKELLTEHVTIHPNAYGTGKLSVFDSLNESVKINGYQTGNVNYQYHSSIEHGPYLNFYGKYKMKKFEGDWIHDVDEFQLKSFIEYTEARVKSKSAQEYLKKL